jgi:hypothetical protein
VTHENRRRGLNLSAVTFWLFAEAVFFSLHELSRKLDDLMALVSVEQSDLDSIAQTVSDVADSLQAIIDNPNPLDPADETALNAAVAKLQSVGPAPGAVS